MNTNGRGLIKRCRETWWQYWGQQPLVSTFWPQDYRRGTDHWIAGRLYRITHYVRVAGQDFFEVWGKEVVRTGAVVKSDARPRRKAEYRGTLVKALRHFIRVRAETPLK